MKTRNPGFAETGDDIGGCIRSWRKERGMIQKQLAAACGMSVPQLWSVESGRNSPSVKTLSRIASALGVSLSQLFSPAKVAAGKRRRRGLPKNTMEVGGVGLVRIMRLGKGTKDIPRQNLKRLVASAEEAFRLESARQTDMPTSLPLSIPVTMTEGGAAHLAAALRAQMDVGSAIVHNTLGLFETYGVRVVSNADMPESLEALTYYSMERRIFTVFLSQRLANAPWRRDFKFLTEIGRIFIFASHGCEPFLDTAKSRRFAHHFAANFQQPESAVRMSVYSLRVGPDDWTFELLLRLKARFGVSAQSFNIRLKELGLITYARHDEFAARLKRHYEETGFSEPGPDKALPENRPGDLMSLTIGDGAGATSSRDALP